MISKQSLNGRIEKHFIDAIDEPEYESQIKTPAQLLTYNRLDLAIKILYIKMLSRKVEFAKQLYAEHIKALSLGAFSEPGNNTKNNLDDYITEFSEIFKNISKNGFDSDISLVPLAIDGSIANGAHRVAAAYVSKQKVSAIKLDAPIHKYDYNFFLNRGMKRSDIDIAVSKFIEYTPNTFVAIVWPVAKGKDEELAQLFSKVVYRKYVTLSYNGLHNLITQVYNGEPWLGERKDNFRGAANKVINCYKPSGQLRVISFQSDSLDEVVKLKEDIRTLYSIGKHSVHITDTHNEAVQVSRMLFNEKSIHFLNHAKPTKYESTHEKINELKKFINENNLNHEEVLVDSSTTLSLYGLRKSKDIDILTVQNEISAHQYIEPHDSELKYHQEEKDELIFNPGFYFYYDGLKFLAFDQLYKMKSNRAEPKDIYDLDMMRGLVEKRVFSVMLAQVRQRVLYLYAIFRNRIVKLFIFLGVYKTARYYFRKLMRK